jgi:aminopeptidase N
VRDADAAPPAPVTPTHRIPMRQLIHSAALTLCAVVTLQAQTPRVFTHADTLRGSNGAARSWWDATFYDLHVRVNPSDSTITGYNGITYRVLQPAAEMQVDLQEPLAVDSVLQGGKRLAWRRDGSAWFVAPAAPQPEGSEQTVTVFYHGSFASGDTAGRQARGPFHWATDSTGAPWVATSDEGPGASTWWPLKDLPADEPDSQRIAITVPDPMLDISNGRLRSATHHDDGTTTFEWFVSNPINSYDVAINASAAYVPVRDTVDGLDGRLTVEFWPLAPHRAEAAALMPQVKGMLACFEHWFGPYPWYADGYKLIEVPYLGMEHQSGIAYGNRYLPGYLGRDLSKTGEGMDWDYIVVHESAHEWFGNSISSKDHADMWIHESFGMYAEALYLECTKGKAAGERYLVGVRNMIRNDTPIIGTYGVNDVPRSQDRYPKGANMLMTMRAVVDDDPRWLAMLQGLNATFRHQTVTARQVEEYMSTATGTDLRKIFRQYLETTMVPVLEYKLGDHTMSYRWTNVIAGFDMPVDVALAAGSYTRLRPTEQWQSTPSSLGAGAELQVAPAFYVTTKAAAGAAAGN